MSWRDLLLQAYPKSWREEYGSEFAHILAQRRLTPAVVLDVLAGAARQQLREPWKTCSLGLSVWTLALLAGTRFGWVRSNGWFLSAFLAGQLFLFAASAWTAVRKDYGIRPGLAATAKAAVLPSLVLLLVTGTRLLHYWRAVDLLHRPNAYYWMMKDIIFTAVSALLFGLAGVAAARVARKFVS